MVIMNEDGSPGVSADVRLGVLAPSGLVPLGLASLAVGVGVSNGRNRVVQMPTVIIERVPTELVRLSSPAVWREPRLIRTRLSSTEVCNQRVDDARRLEVVSSGSGVPYQRKPVGAAPSC